MAKLKFDFNPFKLFGIQMRGSRRKEALDDIQDFLQDKILEDVSRQKSPVSGVKFKRLSPAYAREKSTVARAVANLELTGDMLDDLKVKEKNRSEIRIEINGKSALKADRHNHFFRLGSGKQSKKSLRGFPKRQFIPDEKKRREKRRPFRPAIMSEMRNILIENQGDEDGE